MYKQLFEAPREGTRKRSELSPLTERRMRKAAEKIAFRYVQNTLSIIQLNHGTSLLLSGQPGLRLTFLGIHDKSTVYQMRGDARIKRELKRVSFGARYDIYTPGYWTRDEIGKLFSGTTMNFNVHSVSRVQATEIVIHDKKEGLWHATWFSLGSNKDTEMTGRQAKVKPGTMKLPDVEPIQKTQRRIKKSFSGQMTEKSMAPADALEQAKEALRRDIHLNAISEGQMIFSGEQSVGIRNNIVKVEKREGSLSLTYEYQGRPVTYDINQTDLSGGHPIKEGHSVHFHAYPIQRDGVPYIVIATIALPSQELHSTFAFFAG